MTAPFHVFRAADGALIEIVGFSVDLPDRTVSAEWVAGLSPEERAELGFADGVDARVDAAPGERVTGSELIDIDGVPTKRNVIAALTDDQVATRRAEILAAIDATAGLIILDRYPLWMQQNMTARAVALLDIRGDRDLTPDEQAEREGLQAAWAWVAAVRNHSNALKATVPATDAAGIDGFDITAGWPA